MYLCCGPALIHVVFCILFLMIAPTVFMTPRIFAEDEGELSDDNSPIRAKNGEARNIRKRTRGCIGRGS